MSAMTVTVNLSAEAAAFMRTCIGDADGPERDAFFESAIAALAEALLELDAVTLDDEDDGTHAH